MLLLLIVIFICHLQVTSGGKGVCSVTVFVSKVFFDYHTCVWVGVEVEVVYRQTWKNWSLIFYLLSCWHLQTIVISISKLVAKNFLLVKHSPLNLCVLMIVVRWINHSKGFQRFKNLMEFSALCEVMGLDFFVCQKKKLRTLVPFFFDVSTPHSNLPWYWSYKSAGDQCR